MLRMNLRIMRVTFSHKKSQRIRSWRPMSNHPKSSIGCSDRLYENDRILSLPGRAGLWASPDTGQGTKFFYSETRKELTFHEEPDKNEAQDIPNGRRLFPSTTLKAT